MDKNGQLTFFDDPLLQGINEAYTFIEAGDFTQAVKKIDDLMTINPDYPGLAEAYRVARFWESRKKAMQELQKGKDTADFLMTQWEEFEAFAQNRGLVWATAYQKAMRFVFSLLLSITLLHSMTGKTQLIICSFLCNWELVLLGWASISILLKH